jgi:hypothetical protein
MLRDCNHDHVSKTTMLLVTSKLVSTCSVDHNHINKIILLIGGSFCYIIYLSATVSTAIKDLFTLITNLTSDNDVMQQYNTHFK